MTAEAPQRAPRRGVSPRKRRQRSLIIQGAIGVVAVGLIAWLMDWPRFAEGYLNFEAGMAMFIAEPTTGISQAVIAFGNTVTYTVLAYLVGMVLGVILALMRMSSIAPYRWFAKIYVEVFRGLPALLVLFLVAYGIPRAFPGFKFPGEVYGQIAFGLGVTCAAYVAESLRAGIQAVPPGQVEAARSLGMSEAKTLRRVVLPQAMRFAIPPLTNEFVMLTKDTALVYTIGVTALTIELTKLAQETTVSEVNPTPLVVGGLLYLLLTIPLSHLAQRLERRMAGDKRS